MIEQILNYFNHLSATDWGSLQVGLLYVLAGVALFVNLRRHEIVRGNKVGLAAVLMLIVGGLHNASRIFTHGSLSAQIIIEDVIMATTAFFIYLILKHNFIVGAYDDMIETRRQLQDQERWMKLMHENMSDGLAVYSLQGRLLYINPAAERLLRLKGEEESHNIDIANFIQDPSIKAKILANETVGTKIFFQQDKLPDRILDVNISPVHGKNNKVIAVVVVYRDITDIYKLERTKEEFIQVASHELRTPLTAARGFLSLAKMKQYGDLSEKQTILIDKSLEATGKLSKLIDNILLVARIEENRISFTPELIKLDDVINNVIEEMSGEAARCNINLKLLWPKEVVPSFYADKDKLYHILTNLVSNAIKYTPDGGHVFIEPRIKSSAIEISITDTGVGIAKNDLSKLFNKFERIENDRSIRVGGTGLGLVIVKSYTELHGGQVRVNSSQGKGSTFTISLPLKQTNYV